MVLSIPVLLSLACWRRWLRVGSRSEAIKAYTNDEWSASFSFQG